MLIYPYKKGSQSARNLAKALGAKRIKQDSTTFIGRAYKKVVNWGNSKVFPEIDKCQVINKPECVALTANKLTFFKHMEGAVAGRVPESTTCIGEAAKWIEDGCDVVERHSLTGHSGKGIRIVDIERDLQQAPLYVKYVPKTNEYRVHVFDGKVLDVQRKARNRDVEDVNVNWKIRNHGNGFIYARNEEHEVPEDVEVQAVNVVHHLGLHFGACDVVWNEKRQKAYVLEVNTAPGLFGTTLDKYAEAFKNEQF